MQEREAVMCKVVDDACRRGLPQGGLIKPAENVVMVVGRSHLEGEERALGTGMRASENR
jgi:hypothetical protein